MARRPSGVRAPPPAAGDDTGVEAVADSFARLLMPLRDTTTEKNGACYNSTVFDTLPDWMANLYDDSETTSPSSDVVAELSVGGGSDDESRSSSPPSVPREAFVPAPAPKSFLYTSWPDAHGADAEESHLIDLDPEEGRCRGLELLSMLRENQPAAAAAVADEDKPARASDVAPPSAAVTAVGACAPREAGGKKEATHKIGGLLGGSAATTLSLATAELMDAAPEAVDATGDGKIAAIYNAACCAFGSNAADVASNATGDYIVVWLSGGPAAQLEYDRQGVLDVLGRALWPLLGQDCVGVEYSVMPPQVTIWCLSETQDPPKDQCWEFARWGVCPRGGRCRWSHATQVTYPIVVEVASTNS